MKTIYVANPSLYDRYYKSQVGNGLAGFKSATIQRGNGLGSIFKGLIRAATPLIKDTILPSLKRKVIATGMKVAKDVMGGRSLKGSLKRRVMDSGRDLAVEAANTLTPMKRRKQAKKRVITKRR